MKGISIGLLSCLPILALAQPASLEAPSEAIIGSAIEVTWAGAGNDYDSIFIILPSADDSASGINTASILNSRNPLQLTMPEEPGQYELRYWDRQAGQVAARAIVNVIDITTSINAAEAADIGETVDINWEGPGNDYDKIVLVEPNSSDDVAPLQSFSILNRRQAQLRMPDVPGVYEIRYATARLNRVLARQPITVEDVASTIEAPSDSEIGATIEITWTGPGNDYDRIELHEEGAVDDARALRSTSILNERNPVTMRLPELAGNFELRYVTYGGNRILTREPFRVGGVDSNLIAADQGTALMPLEVVWEGPGNDYDLIALYPEGATDDSEPVAQVAILNERNPVILNLPAQQGSYEIRYLTTQTNLVLARHPLLVEPAGQLAVVFSRSENLSMTSGPGAVELILDASGSMLQRENGVRRIETARAVLEELVTEHLSDQNEFALRVFGHIAADQCRTDLEIPVGPLNREEAASRIASINAMNLARTPIADSLAMVPSDLAGVEGPKTIVLITDGEETCDGDPASVISELRASGLDVQLSVVGFAIDDAALRGEFESWAELGGGSYFDARSAEELSRSLRTVISGPFQVFDSQGNAIGNGIIGGSPIVLPAGIYRIETLGNDPLVIESVQVVPGEVTEAAF